MIEWDGGSNPRQTSFKARHCNSVGAALQRMATPSKAQPGARADTAICGIDVGTMASCVALARSRGVDVVLNAESERETLAMVSFDAKQRHIGVLAAGKVAMHPADTVSEIKRFLGRPFRDPAVQRDLARLPVKASEAPDGGVRFHVSYGGREAAFSCEQLMAMVLADLRAMAIKGADGAEVAGCVLSVPAYFTQAERRAMLAAAEIAGAGCLSLLNDTTATAIAYGVYKGDLPEGEAVHVAFVDVGYGATQVSVAALTRGGLQVLCHAWDRDLGGRGLDDLIFEAVADDFKARHRVDVRRNPKAAYKLRRQCEKVKKTLSANTEAALNVECLVDDLDCSAQVTRQQLEAWAGPWLDRLRACLQEGIARSAVPASALHAVELVGGTSRVPAVYRAVQEVFGQAPSRTLHAKETVCRGCALQCAMLSPNHKVRPYAVADCLPYTLTGAWEDERGRPGTFEVFPRGAPLPATKSITFHRSGPFAIQLGYVPDSGLTKAGPPTIASCTIGPLKLPRGVRSAPIRVTLAVDAAGLAGVSGAAWIEEVVAGGRPLSPSVMFGGARAATPPRAGTPPPAPRVLAEVAVAFAQPGLAERDIAGLRQAELRMEAADRLQEETQGAKNALESCLYSLRARLSDGLAPGLSPKERDAVAQRLSSLEAWLYGEGEDVAKGVYDKKLQELKDLGAKLGA